MAESMKFGPEWLRNMSQDGNPSGPAPAIPSVGPKYQLADYRYGREEMLALYDEQGVRFSETIIKLAVVIDPMLYTVEPQTPLSFIPMTEEDTRNYNRSFNSRGFSNTVLGNNVDTIGGPGGKPLSKANTSPLLISPNSARDPSSWNRFSGVERGRGRGGPGATYHTRPGKDGSTTEMYNNTIHRNRFGVNADMQAGRVRVDRNVIPDPDSKKENLGLNSRLQNLSSGSVSDNNWRRFREEDESWRPNFNRANSTGNNTEKWGSRGSWRQQAEQNGRSIGGERDVDKWEKERAGNNKWEESSKQNHQYPEGAQNNKSNGNNNGVSRFRRYSFNEENLPEWATENLPEARGGTFDSNGAYHGTYSDDELENPVKNKEPNINANRFYSSQSRVITSNIFEDSVSLAAPYGPSNSPKPFETISPTPHMDNHPSSMKPNEPSASSLAVQESRDKGEIQHVHQHSMSRTASTHKNSALEPNNQPDSNELMNQRLSKVVDDIDRLITEEDTKEPQYHNNVSPVTNGPGSSTGKDKWLYKDPQGNVQGPFSSTAMAEWYRTGYFRSNLLVKRMCDEVFSPLGDLLHFFGNIPFLADNSFPPIKASDHIASQNTKPLDEAILIQEFRDAQYKQVLMSQQQQLVEAIVKNLRQLDNWSNMSILEQNSLIMQHVNQILHRSNVSGMLFNQNTTAPINIPPSNPIMQLVAEMTRQEPHFTMTTQQHQQPTQPPNPLSQIITPPTHQQMPTTPHQNIPLNHMWGVSGEKDFMRLDSNNYYPQPIVGTPNTAEAPNTQAQNQFDQLMHMLIREDIDKDPSSSLSSQQSVKPQSETPLNIPPLVQPIAQPSVGEVSTNNAVDLPSEKISVDEKKKKKQQEDIEKEMQERERKQRLKEDNLKKQQQEEEKRKEEEKKKEEEKRKKLEDQKRKKEEKEKLKKQEEEKRKKAEEEKLLQESKNKQNEEKRKVEQQRQEEALRKLVQQQLKEKSSNKTWTTPAVSSAAPQTALADIQKLEKEQKQQQQQIKNQQQSKKQQKTQQQPKSGANETPKASKKSDKSKEANAAALKAGWASQKPVPVKTKSIAEIQAEQTEQLAKQLEKEKLERLANPKKVEVTRSKTQIWGSTASSITTPNYAQASVKTAIPSKINDSTQPLANSKPLSGFWDEPVKILSNQNTSKINKNTSSSKSSNDLGSSSALSNSSNKKLKKEEIKIKEIFTTSALKDSSSSEIKFMNWCTNTLASMKTNDLDIPTFIGFLKEIESQKEVIDYVKLYIGEGKQAISFAKQYLEKRQGFVESEKGSKFNTNSAIKIHQEQPKSKSNSQNSTKKTTEFVEVKAKNKKNKKGKMRHIDTTLLGFSVTADPDRFNVGERELPDV